MIGLLATMVPAILFAVFIYRIDRDREPIWLVSVTFISGGIGAVLANLLVGVAARATGLSPQVGGSGEAGSLILLFGVVAPVQELAKVAANWAAFRSRHFDEPFDGIVYASMAGLGFALVDGALIVHAHPEKIWLLRAMLALPAHWFFSCGWGYALGRVQTPEGKRMFPGVWLIMTIAHGLYIHVIYGRGVAALVAVIPLLLAMGVVVTMAARDLRHRGERVSILPASVGDRMSRLNLLGTPPTFQSMREALRKGQEPIAVRWILFGAIVTIGSMIVGVMVAIGFGHAAHLNFSLLDERESESSAALALLGSGVLGAFPLSGFLIARAAGLPTLLETALATGLALTLTVGFFAMAVPGAVIFAVAFAPVAWAFACVGAWIGRTKPSH